jgi:quercetin dioxygenase-like cupin family protein
MRMISPLTVGLLALVAIATASCARGASQADPVAISPQYYTVLLDSNHVRVLEYRLPAGRREPMHSHPAYVVYFFQAAKLRAIYPDGHSSESLVTRGETLYREALTHSIENIGDTEVHALLVELAPSLH